MNISKLSVSLELMQKYTITQSRVLKSVTELFLNVFGNSSGGAVPAFAQLASSSYHAAVSSSSLPPSHSQDDKMHKSRTSSTI